MRNPPKIVITGITSFRNRGVEALVTCTVEALRERVPGATFTVLDRSSEYDAGRLVADDVRFVEDGTFRHWQAGKFRKLASALFPVSDPLAARARRVIAEADAVVASGGDLFCSEYGSKSLRYCLEPLRVAWRSRVPFFLHAQSIGPFGPVEDREAFVETARHAEAITVRERASFDYMIKGLQFPAEKIKHVADPAFLLKHEEPARRGAELFEHLRARPDRPTIGLSISQAICAWKGADESRHLETWREIIGWLRQELDANVILIPHVQERSDGNNDLVPATALQREMGWDPSVRLAGGNLSASDFKAILSRCDFAVVERMHAGIACLSTGVPVLTVGYSVKAEGILTDLLGGELTRSLALISIGDFLQPGAAITRVREAWERRAETAAVLASALPAARERARQACDPVAALFSKTVAAASSS